MQTDNTISEICWFEQEVKCIKECEMELEIDRTELGEKHYRELLNGNNNRLVFAKKKLKELRTDFDTQNSKISMIVAVSDNGVIGKNNALPWHVPSDLEFFKKMTTKKPIIMGRNTAESLKRPLPNRINIVLTKSKSLPAGFIVVESMNEALEIANEHETEVMIVGGGQIYSTFMPLVTTVYLTRIHQVVDGDTFFSLNEEWVQVYRKTVDGVCSFCKFERRENDHEI